jgi:hypothetical protein
MNKFLSELWLFFSLNIADPFKSVAHFFRSGATFSLAMSLFEVIMLPIGRLMNPSFGSNWSLFDITVIAGVSAIVLFISKLFIKE